MNPEPFVIMPALRPTLLLLFFSTFVTHLAAQEAFTAGPKFSGGGSSPLLQSFINQDKSWYQDARQAYHGDDLIGSDGALAKLDWSIAYTQFQAANHFANNPGIPFTPDDEIFPYEDGLLLVEITCENSDVWMQVEPAITALGGTVLSHDGRVINAWLPIEQNGQASQIEGISFIRPAYRDTRSGETTSQGDRALKANLARELTPGFTGAGITIGTLSDSFATAPAPATTAPQDIDSNDLPVGIDVLSEFSQPASDEGRAMMQIIHDLAPGASQKFFTAFNGQADFANGIRALSDSGCDIIVDDVFFFAEPFFQNGLIAQAVNEVTAAGKAYFSAAGNSGRNSYESTFRITENATGLSGGPLHDFDPGAGIDTFMEFTIPVGSSVTFVLQWDEPFFSVSGAPGCQSDIDVFLTGSGDGQFRVLTGGFARNQGGDAVEIFTFTNQGDIDIDGQPGPDTRFNLAIEGLAGNAPGLMKILFMNRGDFTQNEFITRSGTLVGHANAETALAVAASAFFNTPSFGVNPPQLESFSSPGGTPLLFADDGTRLSQPLDTEQPRFTSVDGGNTTFFGQQINDGDNFPNFFGTSAAAPHAAAVAALMLEANGGSGSLAPAEIDLILQSAAIDIGPVGVDVESGAGLIDALTTIELLQNFSFDTPSVVSFLEENGAGDPLLPDIVMVDDNQSWLNANVWDNNAVPSQQFDYLLSAIGNDTMRTSPENQVAGGNANFTGNSLTVTDGTRLLVKQETDQVASINSGAGDIILTGGRLAFAPNRQRSTPEFRVRNFRVVGDLNPIVEVANFVSLATINGRLTGDGNFRIRVGGSAFNGGHSLTFTDVDEDGFSGQMDLGNEMTLAFQGGAIFKGGARLVIQDQGILNVNAQLAFREGQLRDQLNGTVAPGVYFGPRLTSLGSNYQNNGGSLIISNSLEDSDNDGILDALEELIINADETDNVLNLTDVDLESDFDGDGLTDAVELATLSSDPTLADSDSDGKDDAQEAADGTDPFDPLDLAPFNPQLTLTPVFENGELIQVQFTAIDLNPNLSYAVVRGTDLVTFPNLVGDRVIFASAPEVTDESPPENRAFYRLVSAEVE